MIGRVETGTINRERRKTMMALLEVAVTTNRTHINPQQTQHDLTPRIYVLHKITIALKFMSYINQKLRPKLSNRVKFMSYTN